MPAPSAIRGRTPWECAVRSVLFRPINRQTERGLAPTLCSHTAGVVRTRPMRWGVVPQGGVRPRQPRGVSALGGALRDVPVRACRSAHSRLGLSCRVG